MQKDSFRFFLSFLFFCRLDYCCSKDETFWERGEGTRWNLDMTIGHGNWNGCHFWCFGMLQGLAAEMLRKCCGNAVAMPLLLSSLCCTAPAAAAAGCQARSRCVFTVAGAICCHLSFSNNDCTEQRD